MNNLIPAHYAHDHHILLISDFQREEWKPLKGATDYIFFTISWGIQIHWGKSGEKKSVKKSEVHFTAQEKS